MQLKFINLLEFVYLGLVLRYLYLGRFLELVYLGPVLRYLYLEHRDLVHLDLRGSHCVKPTVSWASVSSWA